MRAITKRFLYAFVTLVLCVVTVFCGQGNLSVSADAAESVQATYESTNVLNNLKGATIGGKEFDLADYPHNSNGKPQVISFVEFCYSYYAEKQADYGLYVYVYNPQAVAVDMSTERNKIQFTYGAKQSYSKYVLEFINYSTDAGYEGRFWKFKVKLTDGQRSDILREVEEDNRVYKISGIELSVKSNVTEYPCGQTYTYKGYALGYGSELAQSDTLSCKVDGLDKYLSLDVHSTFFRGKGTNGKKYIQDTLHSVYFSVPNSIIEEYGKMTAVHATWLDAYTAPALVTGNSSYYETMLDHIGENIGIPETYEDLNFYYSFRTEEDLVDTSIGGVHFSGYYYGYNYPSKLSSSISKNITNLHWLFKAENGNADEYDVSSETILDYMNRYTATHGGELVNNKYSKALFESVDSSFTDINIRADDTYSLTSEIISKNFWEKLFGGSHVEETEEFNDIKAIEAVDYKDIANLDSVQICKKYYVDDADYEEFSSFCKTAKVKNETVYLFRYKQSEYFSAEVYEGTWKRQWVLNTGGIAIAPGYVYSYKDSDTNAFVMQQWVQLDFDIIDLTFTKDDVETVIPVVMSPMDIVADGDHPVVTTKDGGLAWWQILLGIIALIFIIWLLLKFAPLIVYAIGKIIMLPFKAIGVLFKAGKKRQKADDERQKEKANRKIEKECKKVERLSNKISTRNHKKIVKGNKKIERDAKKVDVPVLKKKVLSGEISRWDLSRAETYALGQDAEYTEIMDMYDEAMSTSYDPFYDDDFIVDEW